jgi:hypothetical protein
LLSCGLDFYLWCFVGWMILGILGFCLRLEDLPCFDRFWWELEFSVDGRFWRELEFFVDGRLGGVWLWLGIGVLGFVGSRFWRPTLGNLVVLGLGAIVFSLSIKALVFPEKIRAVGGKFSLKLSAWIQEGFLQELDDSPVSVELHPVCSETQFDLVLAEA